MTSSWSRVLLLGVGLGTSAATAWGQSAPTITFAAKEAYGAPGTSLTLTPAIGGSPAPSLQWRKDGTPIDGAGDSSFVLPSLAASDAADYTVTASNGSGSVTSAAVRVAVYGVVGQRTRVNNSVVAGTQDTPAVASSSSGQHVIAWRDGFNVRARLYDANSLPLGDQFTVRSTTGITSLTGPKVAMNTSGAFVVVWREVLSGTSRICAQAYTAAGEANGALLVVATSVQTPAPLVAMNDAGSFVAVWVASIADSSDPLRWSSYDSAGNVLAGPVSVAKQTYQAIGGNTPAFWLDAVAMGAASEVCVACHQSVFEEGPSYSIGRFGPYEQSFSGNNMRVIRFNAGGAQVGLFAWPQTTLVNSTSGGSALRQAPVINLRADGTGIVSWKDYYFSPTGNGTVNLYFVGLSYARLGPDGFGGSQTSLAQTTAGPPFVQTSSLSMQQAILRNNGGFELLWRMESGAQRLSSYLPNGTLLGQPQAIGSATAQIVAATVMAEGTGTQMFLTGAMGAFDTANGTDVYRVTLGTPPPSAYIVGDAFQFEAQGASKTLTAGSNDPAATFQWQKEGVVLPGETLATLTFGSLTAAHAGSYTVVATNAAGSRTSSVRKLIIYDGTVQPLATITGTILHERGPMGDTFAVLPSGTQVQRYGIDGTAIGGPISLPVPAIAALDVNAKGEFAVVWDAGMRIRARRFDASGTPLTPEIETDADGTTASEDAPDIAMDTAGNLFITWENGWVSMANQVQHSQRFNASGTSLGAPVNYQRSIKQSSEESFHVHANARGKFGLLQFDKFSNTPKVSFIALYDSISDLDPASAAGASSDLNVVRHTALGGLNSGAIGYDALVWRWSPALNLTTLFGAPQVNSIGMDGRDWTLLSWTAGGTPMSGWFDTSLTLQGLPFPSSNGAVAMDEGGGFAIGTGGFKVYAGRPCVRVLSNPALSGNENTSLALTVQVNSALAATLQWRRNGVPIDGATGTALTLGSLTASDAGTYDVVATNSLGSTTSFNSSTVSVISSSPFGQWAASYPSLTGPDVALLADPDGDGKPNYLEYAVGSDPTVADSTAHAAGATGTGTAGDPFVFTFYRLPANTDLTYEVQTTTTPGTADSWTGLARSTGGGTTSALLPSVTAINETAAGNGTVRVDVTLNVSGSASGFYRLEVKN